MNYTYDPATKKLTLSDGSFSVIYDGSRELKSGVLYPESDFAKVWQYEDPREEWQNIVHGLELYRELGRETREALTDAMDAFQRIVDNASQESKDYVDKHYKEFLQSEPLDASVEPLDAVKEGERECEHAQVYYSGYRTECLNCGDEVSAPVNKEEEILAEFDKIAWLWKRTGEAKLSYYLKQQGFTITKKA